MSYIAVFGTIAGATVAWAAAEFLLSRSRHREARFVWTCGALLAWVHSVAAFGVFYGWTHQHALAATARQTRAITGINWDGGLYFNYLFLVIWLADAAWWWLSPSSHAGRHAAIGAAVRGFLFFMFLNGAVIFADGWMRVLGVAAAAVVMAAWYRRRWR